MTESDIRAKLKELIQEHEATGSPAPTCLHIVYDEQHKPKGAEIRADEAQLWRWPKTYRSRLKTPLDEIHEPRHKSYKFSRKDVPLSDLSWKLCPSGQNVM